MLVLDGVMLTLYEYLRVPAVLVLDNVMLTLYEYL